MTIEMSVGSAKTSVKVKIATRRTTGFTSGEAKTLRSSRW